MRKAVVILGAVSLAALAWRVVCPAVRQVRLEHQLMANLARTLTEGDADPLTALKTAVRLTFPQLPREDVRKITAYAAFQLAPPKINGHDALTQGEWARKVVTYALAQEQA
jgi:hypothetical protein